MCGFTIVFFFKQKTAYEMRISDWSSDVCSSDRPAGRSEIRRFLIDFLRSKGRPVKTLEAHKALMEARGIDTRDKALTVLMRKHTTDAFSRMKKVGLVEGRKYGSGSELEWRLLERP